VLLEGKADDRANDESSATQQEHAGDNITALPANTSPAL